MMFKRILPYLFLSLLIAACGAAPNQTAEGLTEITVMLDWVPNTNHTGLFVAQSQGWYEANGLDVTIIQAGEVPVAQVVASGSADFGISYQEGATMARAEGVPIVSVAAIIQHNTSGFASRAEANIQRPKDFEGKRYGSYGAPIERAMLDVLMQCDGGDVSEVAFVDTGFADFFSITERDIDFGWIFYGWDGISAELRDIDLNIVMLNEWDDCVPDYYTPILITNETTVSERPDIARAFVSATARGYEFAIENPAQAADMLLEASPESDPELIRASQAWLSEQYQANAARWGVQDVDIWQRYSAWLVQQGILDEPIDANAAFTNQFLP